MTDFQVFYIEKFEFDKTTLRARFFYSFDHSTPFIEEVDFSDSHFQVKYETLEDNTTEMLLFHITVAL